MANFINIYSSITEYNADETKQYPNVSYLETEDEVKWQATEPIDQEHVVAKYDVVDTTNPTSLLHRNGAANITKMYIDGVEQQSVVTGYTFSTTGTHTVKYKVNSSWGPNFSNCATLTSITMPDSVSGINNYAFSNCSGLTKVHIPSGATKIGEYAFQNCKSLSSITIPDNATSIGYAAFSRCSGLTSISIGSGATSISNYAFADCSSLTSITVTATTPPSMTDFMTLNNTNNCPIYVPADSVNAYKTTYAWSNYASRIQAIQ